MRRHLVLFVRAPELGHGKRRLAREIGDVATVRFERADVRTAAAPARSGPALAAAHRGDPGQARAVMPGTGAAAST